MNEELIELGQMDFKEITEEYTEAKRLHNEILMKKDIAGNALLELAKSLKLMRDTKLFTHLGYENFENYCEEACGFKQRQAYSYISSYEKLGSQFLQSNASLGITKLELLGSLAPDERETFVDENEVADMTTKELKEAIEKLNAFEEQVSLLKNENTKLKEDVKEAYISSNADNELSEELKQVKAELKKAQAEIKDTKAELKKPKAIDAKEIEKIKAEAVLEEKQRLEKLTGDKIADLEADIKKAVAEKEQLKKDMAVSSDKNLTMFSFLVEGLQDIFIKIKTLIEGLGADEQAKYRGAVIKLCNKLISEMEG